MDIAVIWNVAKARGDWTISSGDLALDNPLRSAVMVSLFSDRVAPEQPSQTDQAVGITPPGNAANSGKNDRRGWWGDAYEPDQIPIGSRLWQLQRAVKAGDTAILRDLKQMVIEALTWMKNDGVVTTIAVDTAWSATSANVVEFSVTLTEPGSAGPQTFFFSWAWEGL